jgi:hypothetical protein
VLAMDTFYFLKNTPLSEADLKMSVFDIILAKLIRLCTKLILQTSTFFLSSRVPSSKHQILFYSFQFVCNGTEKRISYFIGFGCIVVELFVSLTASNHLPLTDVGSNPDRDFGLSHVRKLSS